MKIIKFSLLAFLTLIALNFNSCTGKGTTTEETTEKVVDQAETDAEKEVWEAAKEQYHTVMSSAFHSAEENNLEPLKEKYAQLATFSKEWVKLPVPAEYQKEKITTALKDLEQESAAIASVVENGTDDEMKKAIYALHDVFHKVQELCEDH